MRPTLTVFAPATPERPGPRIWNEQLIRYAGYRRPDGTVLGDPRYVGFTNTARELGWPGWPRVILRRAALGGAGHRGASAAVRCPQRRRARGAVQPSPLPFADLGLRWHAVPAIANMCLEIGAHNLADTDRYNLLSLIAARLGLDTAGERSLWRDRALVELNLAVLHSFDTAGVTIADHHTECHRFLTHLAREQRAGRITPADWSWIVPPISRAATPVFHRYYDSADLRPNYVHHPRATRTAYGVAPA